MRKQTPVLDKKEKDVSDSLQTCVELHGSEFCVFLPLLIYRETVLFQFSLEEMSPSSVIKAPLISV